jgi:hypothetical protein
MHVNPTRFAIGISGALACLGIGLVAGVSAGTSHAAHLYGVRTVTATVPGGGPVPAAAKTVTVVRTVAQRQSDAAARTVTSTVVRTVTDRVTVTAAAPPPPKPAGPHHNGHGPGHGPGHGGGPGNGPGPGDGGPGGG